MRDLYRNIIYIYDIKKRAEITEGEREGGGGETGGKINVLESRVVEHSAYEIGRLRDWEGGREGKGGEERNE